MDLDRRECFVVLMADQLAAQWLPAYGHPLAQTPHLDALARDGVVFESAYCPFPLCAPSRAAMLTGRLASAVGVYDNAAELAASVPTAVHSLRAGGYETTLVGKMHFVGPDQLHGFEERLTTDIYPADVTWTPDWDRRPGERLPWYHTIESVLEPGVVEASMQTDYDHEVSFRAVRKLFDLARDGGGRPFLLVVSFSSPHDPWEVPRRYWERYRRAEIELPEVPSLPLERTDPHSRGLRAMCGFDDAGLSAEQIRTARHGYFAALSFLDERVGEVLAALRDSGLAERTTVLFTADHGEMLGERGLWYKMSFFEPSVRVPLIVRRVGARGSSRVLSPVSLIDLAPTLVELAGAPPLPELDGVSLAPVLAGDGAEPGRVVLAEYHAEGVKAPSAMIRDGSHKLIASAEDPDLLFDLDADPLELNNVAGDPAYADRVGELRAKLFERLDFGVIDRRVRASQRDRHLVASALHTGKYTPWDYEPRVDASMQYVRSREDLYRLQREARLESGVKPDDIG